jgi:MtaA/CmuA family methyltransferase
MADTPMTGPERVRAVLEGRPPDRPPLMPITMMFAARQIGARYRDYITDHRVLVEAQIHTAERFGFDHVSCISDPVREAADWGAVVELFDDHPPAIAGEQALLADKSDLAHLTLPDPHGGRRMHDRVEAISLFRRRVGHERLIEGWVEGPIAEAANLRGINALMLDLLEDPIFARELMEVTVELGLAFARAQVEAGADLIGVGDAAASLIGPALHSDLIWPFEKRLIDGIHEMGAMVRLHICGDTRPLLAAMGELGCEIVDLDSMVPLGTARERMGPDQVLLGNLNPVDLLLQGTPEAITAAVAQCHQEAGPRHIVGAGCEIPPGTSEENMFAMCDWAIHSSS